jgi:hypothetical protein
MLWGYLNGFAPFSICVHLSVLLQSVQSIPNSLIVYVQISSFVIYEHSLSSNDICEQLFSNQSKRRETK